MEKISEILALYEGFACHQGALSGGKGFFDYMAPSSLHSDITCFAYGIRKRMSCIDIREAPAVSLVELEKKDLSRRFYLKLTACLFDWEKYVCGIALWVNGTPAYENREEFFENVNLGWPTIYIPLDAALLKPGRNELLLRQTGGETALLVSVMELISLPGREIGQQISFRSAVRRGGTFALSFYTAGEALTVAEETRCRVLEMLPYRDETILTLEALGEAPELKVSVAGKIVAAVMPEVVEPGHDICLVGTDSDDHRHDDSDETDRILEIFTNTSMGDFWQARPQKLRNYYTLSCEAVWQERIRRLKAFGIRVSQADGEGAMPWLSRACGDSFIGRHFHEAYLYFCAALERAPEMAKKLQMDIPALRSAESFGESKERFVQALKRMYDSCQDNPGLTSVGSPSLLTVYEARAGFERVTIEPVSNIALLIGAVRGAAPRQWGAHVPTDWYFGEPNDACKSRKFMLAMQLLYINGADYIYAENALFKTAAFSREDWEDPFCVRNRQYLRQFFDYKERNPREGALQTDLAVVYGNHEFFMWHHDDRVAELPENGDWDQKLWGKWTDNSHHKCWRAIDAWLPLAAEQNSRENVLNLNLFSGTPYGAVDVVPYDGEFGKYRALAWLGWNTCTDGFAHKLYDFVSAGGHAFVSACHFNRTDRCDLPFEYDEAQRSWLLGKAEGKVPFAYDPAGEVLVWQMQMGSGILYYGTFEDYICTSCRMEVMQAVLRKMGEDTAQAVCDNPNISFTLRRTEAGRQFVHALNVRAGSEAPASYTIRLKTSQEAAGTAVPCQIQTHIL